MHIALCPAAEAATLRAIAISLTALTLAGCTTFMATQDASNPTVVAQATAIPFYTAENAGSAPPVKTILGPAIGNSCKLHITDQNGSEIAALQQLRLKALAMGATGVVGVRYEHGGTSLATNCWQSVTASGTAVIFGNAVAP